MNATVARSAFPWSSLAAFFAVVVVVYAASLAVVARLPQLEAASTVALALTADLVLLVPLAYYFLMVRRGGRPLVTLAPVLVVCLLVAGRILPADHQQGLRVMELIVAPIELALVGWIGWRAFAVVRRARRSEAGDPLQQLTREARDLLGNERAAGIFASEVGMFYYALASWRARPHIPDGSLAFTHHRSSGQAGIVFAFVGLMLIEAVLVHLLLMKWSAVVAWLFTIGTIYGVVWMIADYRATVLRPILVMDDRVLIRAGLRWTLELPRGDVERLAKEQPQKSKDTLNLPLLGSPTHSIELTASHSAQGLYGTHRVVRRVGLQPDDAEGLSRALTQIE